MTHRYVSAAISALVLFTAQTASVSSFAATAELKLFWSAARGDYFSTPTAQGQQDAINSGYSLLRSEGAVHQTQEPGTIPLKLFWSSARGDNMSTATAQGERDALAAGYQFVRVEGFIFSTPRAGTAPLKQFWNAARGDNFVTSTSQGESNALGSGYGYVRIEGYVINTPAQCISACKRERADCKSPLDPRDPGDTWEIAECNRVYSEECLPTCAFN